jgi:two-component system cell cycle sensor histidine kinase/response regulator CckA
MKQNAVSQAASVVEIKPEGGTETILVTEDEPSLRMLVCTVLRLNGYQILEAANGIEALQVWQDQPEGVELLLTDMVMP